MNQPGMGTRTLSELEPQLFISFIWAYKFLTISIDLAGVAVSKFDRSKGQISVIA
jgi:hypothetical protein